MTTLLAVQVTLLGRVISAADMEDIVLEKSGSVLHSAE